MALGAGDEYHEDLKQMPPLTPQFKSVKLIASSAWEGGVRECPGERGVAGLGSRSLWIMSPLGHHSKAPYPRGRSEEELTRGGLPAMTPQLLDLPVCAHQGLKTVGDNCFSHTY
ncbi:hypothetical protein AAFF_G00106010 [Aldrovandia affinis]|uniref:Uncharacterized protein n=1 Tax=Aldrovandia affinis TaxID=143900 RepID=A0AAD7T225_9TELE|nr:hypothetical protein AAFF_G00106010 [Aldrovandia affinis]